MQRSKFIIAIDPGKLGAISSYVESYEKDPSVYGPPAPPRWEVEKLEGTPSDRFEQLERYADAASKAEAPRIAILETVGGFTGTPQPGSRMFTFGQGYGQLEGFLIALGYQIIRVRPQAWQRALSLLTSKTETKSQHKRRMRGAALDLFPQLKPTLDQADALLILYAHLKENHIDK